MVKKNLRPEWEELHMLTAIKAATRTSCLKRPVGANLVINKRDVASGYNGAPSGIKNCLIDYKECYYERLAWDDHEKGCGPFHVLKEQRKIFCIANHAETNTMQQCVDMQVSPVGGVLYITNYPCPRCVLGEIIPNKLSGVVVWKDYLRNPLLSADEFTISTNLLKEAGIPIEKMELSDARIREITEMYHVVGNKTDYVFQP